GPPALAGVVDVAADLGQVRVLLEGEHQQVQQPGPDHCAVGPGLDDPGDVLDHVRRHQQLVALGVGLHQAVLDAVVHHLGEVPGAHRAGVHEPRVTLGLERVEGRLHRGHVLRVAADHQRVTVLQAPHTAGDAGVDEADAALTEHRGVVLVVGPPRVAAVHHD